MTMCLSKSQHDDITVMCLSKSQDDDIMVMCLSKSQDDDIIPSSFYRLFILTKSSFGERYGEQETAQFLVRYMARWTRFGLRTIERNTNPAFHIFIPQTKALEGRTKGAIRSFQARFKGVSTLFGLRIIEQSIENPDCTFVHRSKIFV